MNQDTPTAAAQAAFDALSQGNADILVRLAHPQALEDFKRHQLAMAALQGGRLIVGDQVFPNMPSMLGPLYKVASIDEFTSLPPAVVLTRWLHNRFKQRGPSPQRIVLGFIGEGPDQAHVVFREEAVVPEGQGPWVEIMARETIRVLTTRRIDGAWSMMLNGGIVFNDEGTFSFGWSDDDEAA